MFAYVLLIQICMYMVVNIKIIGWKKASKIEMFLSFWHLVSDTFFPSDTLCLWYTELEPLEEHITIFAMISTIQY